MTARREILLLVSLMIILNIETISATEPPHSPDYNSSILCEDFLARPNYGILHIAGRMDRRHLKPARPGKARHDQRAEGPHEFPVLLLSTSSDDETAACQEVVEVDTNGMFQTDVAVSNEFSSWSAVLLACRSGNGKHKGSRCRTVHIAPPGEHSSDGCRPVATRVVPTGHDYPDKSRYVAKVDFRRCRPREHHPSNVKMKPRMVAVSRPRRHAGAYPEANDEQQQKTGGRHGGKNLDGLVRGTEDNSNIRPLADRRSYQQQTHRRNTKGARKVPVNAENQPTMKRINRVRMRDYQYQVGSDQEAKRRWENSGMAWMKKSEDRRMWNGGGKLADGGGDDKRRWEKSGMSWMKRRENENAKRRWENSGMSWLKRPAYNDDDNDHYYDKDVGELEEAAKRRWEKSGVSWIKRRN